MDEIIKKRESLIREYQEVSQQETQMEKDVLLGKRNDDLFFMVEEAKLSYKKDKICAALFETIVPFFEKVCSLTEEIVEAMKRSGKYSDELKLLKKRQVGFQELKDRILYIVNQCDNDLYEMGIAIKEIDEDCQKGKKEDIKESVENFRILRGISKICGFEEGMEFFDRMQSAVEKYTRKLESLNSDQPKEE